MSTKIKHKERSHRSFRRKQEQLEQFNINRFKKIELQNQKVSVSSLSTICYSTEQGIKGNQVQMYEK